jgi:hypothetical protein
LKRRPVVPNERVIAEAERALNAPVAGRRKRLMMRGADIVSNLFFCVLVGDLGLIKDKVKCQ